MDKITVCMGSSCFSKGNKNIAKKIIEFITAHHLEKQVTVQGCLCRGLCKEGPVVDIKGKTFSRVTEEEIESILTESLEVK
jgi:NADH:ubiquinone oxidoreductase subunit E